MSAVTGIQGYSPIEILPLNPNDTPQEMARKWNQQVAAINQNFGFLAATLAQTAAFLENQASTTGG